MDIREILKERGKTYGEFKNHAEKSQCLKECLKQFKEWKGLSDSQKEALEMIAHKIARVLNGDPNYADSWADIAGYAQLIVNELEE